MNRLWLAHRRPPSKGYHCMPSEGHSCPPGFFASMKLGTTSSLGALHKGVGAGHVSQALA